MSTTRDTKSTMRHNKSTTKSNTSTKEARISKIGSYFAIFVTEISFRSYGPTSQFLLLKFLVEISPTCNIVLNLWILRICICPSKILLSNRGSMMFSTKLRGQPNIRLNTVLQFRYQRRICTPSFVFYQQSIRLIKIKLWPPSENRVSYRKVFIILKYIPNTFSPA